MNLERVLASRQNIKPTWVPVRYEADAGWLPRLPLLPASVRGTLRGIHEIRQGLGDGQGFDAMLWATWAAKSVPDLVAAAPAYLVMDATPLQMERMGHHYGYTSRRARFLGNWKRRATDRLYRQAAHLFPWSQWVAQSLTDEYGLAPDKVTAISPGVDTELYCPRPKARPSDGVTRFLFVGGDLVRKGGDLLLDWAKSRGAALGARAPWELHLVTRDPVPDVPPGVVVHRGLANNSAELVGLYQKCDAFVLPTRADVYSLVSLEALASGLPVVVSRIGGTGEIVRTGETGFLIEPDPEQIADALEKLLLDADLRTRMADAARQDALTRFDVRRSVEKMLGLMQIAG